MTDFNFSTASAVGLYQSSRWFCDRYGREL